MRVGDVFSRVLAMLQEEARRKGIALTGEIDTDATHRVLGDPTRLAQVLLNFAGNALKFTQAGSVTLALPPPGRRRRVVDAALRGAGHGPGHLAGRSGAHLRVVRAGREAAPGRVREAASA